MTKTKQAVMDFVVEAVERLASHLEADDRMSEITDEQEPCPVYYVDFKNKRLVLVHNG